MRRVALLLLLLLLLLLRPAQVAAEDAVPAPLAATSEPLRIGSVKWRTWIWPTPMRSSNHVALGSLRIGTTVKLKSAKPVSGLKWYAIEPFGYVLADDTTTRDFDTPYWKALSSLAPKDGAWPYRYAWSTGAPMYSRIPTPQEQESAERGMGPKRRFRPLGDWSKSHEVLIGDSADTIALDTVDLFDGHEPVAGSPWHPANPKVRSIPEGSGFSFVKAFRAAGRVWLLTPEMLLVPADRAFVYERSTFSGVELDGQARLPLAWIRGPGAPQLDQELRPTGDVWRNQQHVLLGTEERHDGTRRFRRATNGNWLELTRGVSVVERITALKHGIKSDERWVWASITAGTMVAYDGLKPIWTTMWSGGKGGVPGPGLDPKKYATTEVGVFPIEWKDRVATMSPDQGSPTSFWFADVPHIQYVKAPLALHVAFWHDKFGHLMSAECLNVSAEDGRWLFGFTRPTVPPGWNSIRPHKLSGRSSKFYIVP